MGYGDYIPSGSNHKKKPLTKGQIKKIQAAYASAGTITESVRSLEKKEQSVIQDKIENDLNLLY